MSAAAALGAPETSATIGAQLAMVGLPVRSGRICLGRQREALGPGACSEVAVVVGFETAAWVGRHDQSPPPFGRLCWHATSTLDGRGRVVLDRRARAYFWRSRIPPRSTWSSSAPPAGDC